MRELISCELSAVFGGLIATGYNKIDIVSKKIDNDKDIRNNPNETNHQIIDQDRFNVSVALALLEKTHAGAALIDLAERDGLTINIHYDDRIGSNAILQPTAADTDSSWNVINWHPLFGLDIKSGGTRDPIVALAHEMVHALIQNNLDNIFNTINKYNSDGDDFLRDWENYAEYEAVKIENHIANELGLDLRINYADVSSIKIFSTDYYKTITI